MLFYIFSPCSSSRHYYARTSTLRFDLSLVFWRPSSLSRSVYPACSVLPHTHASRSDAVHIVSRLVSFRLASLWSLVSGLRRLVSLLPARCMRAKTRTLLTNPHLSAQTYISSLYGAAPLSPCVSFSPITFRGAAVVLCAIRNQNKMYCRVYVRFCLTLRG